MGKVTWMIDLLTLTVTRAQIGDGLLWDPAMANRFEQKHARMCAKTISLKACRWRGFEGSDSQNCDWRGCF
jgi:hypothetical protein